jgi:hypothetical protein
MKPRIVIIFILVIILLLASWAIAWARTSPDGETSSYKVESGLAAGEGYQLIHLNWQISGTPRGEGYLISAPTASSSITSGCCCTFLPCVKR